MAAVRGSLVLRGSTLRGPLFWAVCRSGRISWVRNTAPSVPDLQHRNTWADGHRHVLASGGAPETLLDRILNG
jgi:hypothetical protein